MYFIHLYTVCVFGFLLQKAMAEAPKFRILAPPFVCPKDKDAVIDKPDNTFVTLQTEPGAEVTFAWQVGCVWFNMLHKANQRHSIRLWQSIRDLEIELNEPQLEPGVYIIDNTQLLKGVVYVFNVTCTSPEGESSMQQFSIDNMKGDQKLVIDGRTELFSIKLIGSEFTYRDMEYLVDALVTACGKTSDYYFVWSVTSSNSTVDASDTKGSRLQLKPYTLTAGQTYHVVCKVFKYSTEEFVTQDRLSFRVLYRELKLYFNVDTLVMSLNTPFHLETNIKNFDYSPDEVTINWACAYKNKHFYNFSTDDQGGLIFPVGVPREGEYIISVTVNVNNKPERTKSAVRIIAVAAQLPIIEVSLIPRESSENSIVNLRANVTNVMPGCAITWYFTHYECQFRTNSTNLQICTDSPRGNAISDPVTFYSLEENFLNELSDYTSEMTWKLVETEMQVASGTALLVAECECNAEKYNCSDINTAYAELNIRVNKKPPGAEEVLVMPGHGTAMETIYRISTRALVDRNRPLRYTFYCDLEEDRTLMLGTYLEHLAVETMLPYIDGGTSVWIEVCDSLGACSIGPTTLVTQAPGRVRTYETLLEEMQMFAKRCELELLQRLAISAIYTYFNTGHKVAGTNFTEALIDTLRNMDEHCISRHYEQYGSLLTWLSEKTDTQVVLYDSWQNKYG